MRNLPARSSCSGAGGSLGMCRMGQQRGASLAETIIAIGIVVAAMNVLAQVFVAGLDASAEVRARATAALLAQEKLEEILAARDRLAEWEDAALETYEPAGPEGAARFARPGLERFQWSWRLWDLEGRPGMKEVAVQVWWRPPRADRWNPAPALRTFLAVPPSGAPSAGDGLAVAEEGAP